MVLLPFRSATISPFSVPRLSPHCTVARDLWRRRHLCSRCPPRLGLCQGECLPSFRRRSKVLYNHNNDLRLRVNSLLLRLIHSMDFPHGASGQPRVNSAAERTVSVAKRNLECSAGIGAQALACVRQLPAGQCVACALRFVQSMRSGRNRAIASSRSDTLPSSRSMLMVTAGMP